MKLFVLIHANMALVDNWPCFPDRGRAYNKAVLNHNDYDIGLACFLDPYGNDHRTEHDKFVQDCITKFDIAEWEESIGQVLDHHMDAILLNNDVTEIVFAGGYATDCLPRSIAFFLSRFGSFCKEHGIDWTIEPSLVYDGRRARTMDEDDAIDQDFRTELHFFMHCY